MSNYEKKSEKLYYKPSTKLYDILSVKLSESTETSEKSSENHIVIHLTQPSAKPSESI